jgi:AraC family transcriptional regulator of adaptative response/methylated-DNA-[protein]-cysteine methyltransferase
MATRTLNSPTRNRLATDDTRWAAVASRDHRAHDAFIYAVKTTGVYCRPTCASKPAKRHNVEFFDSPAAAERAGYRACKRCKPDQSVQQQGGAALIEAACRMIDAGTTRLDELSAGLGISASYFHRLFKNATGLTPKQYADAQRTKRVKRALAEGEAVTAALYQAGFASSGQFYSDAKKRLGMSPSAFRKGGEGVRIRFAIGECSLGAILVAATDMGICAISLGDNAGALVRELEERFNKADLVGGDAAFEGWVAQVIAMVETPCVGLHLPLDVQGTAFERLVWEKLCAIPCGQTRSYADIAAELGQLGASRAVGRACGANPIAIAIPCHRVVKKDGGLAGYRWGVERKKTLLQREHDEVR